jgi:hypothetical protein
VLPEGGKTMSTFTPGPENAEKQDDGADDLTSTTHNPKTIPADMLVRGAADAAR